MNDIPANVRVAALQSSKSRSDTPWFRPCESRVPRNMISSGSGTGRFRSSTPLTMVKTALLAPIPSARTTMAMTVNQRFLTSRRPAKRMSRSKSMAAPLEW